MKQKKRKNNNILERSNVFASSDSWSMQVVKTTKGCYWIEHIGDTFHISYLEVGVTQLHTCIAITPKVYRDMICAFECLTSFYSQPKGFYQNSPSFLIGFCMSRGYNIQDLNILV